MQRMQVCRQTVRRYAVCNFPFQTQNQPASTSPPPPLVCMCGASITWSLPLVQWTQQILRQLLGRSWVSPASCGIPDLAVVEAMTMMFSSCYSSRLLNLNMMHIKRLMSQGDPSTAGRCVLCRIARLAMLRVHRSLAQTYLVSSTSTLHIWMPLLMKWWSLSSSSMKEGCSIPIKQSRSFMTMTRLVSQKRRSLQKHIKLREWQRAVPRVYVNPRMRTTHYAHGDPHMQTV